MARQKKGYQSYVKDECPYCEGTKFHLGENVYMGKDHTLHAKVDGLVKFQKKRDNKSYVSIVPFEA